MITIGSDIFQKINYRYTTLPIGDIENTPDSVLLLRQTKKCFDLYFCLTVTLPNVQGKKRPKIKYKKE